MSVKKVTVAKGVKVPKGVVTKMRKKAGSSNVGKYKDVKPSDFVGLIGGASKYAFPIDTLARARSALSRAHFALFPEKLKAAVYRKWPQLKKENR